MKRAYFVCLFQCLTTTLLFAQPDQGPFGSGGLLRRPPLSRWNQARREAVSRRPLSSIRAQRHGYKSSIQGDFQNLTTDASAIFFEAPTYGSGGFDAASIAVADVNGDGKLDLLVANECGNLSGCPNGVVAVLLGNGDGTFQAAQTYSSGGYAAASIVVSDVNGDGKADLVVGNFDGTVGILFGNGDGTFQTAHTYSSGGDLSLSIAVGDVNGDGKPDVLVGDACASDSNCANGVLAVLLGNGDGTFQAAQTYNSGGYSDYFNISIAVGDVNRDGKLDLLVANYCESGSNGCTNYAGVVGVLLGNGDGTFQALKTYGSGGYEAQSIAVADVNGDGKPDLLVANDCDTSGDGCVNSGVVGVLLGNGDGTFQPPVSYNSNGPFAFSITVGDVNGDGKPDLLVSSRGVNVLLGNGDGTFQAPRTYSSGGYNVVSIAVGDVNGDGKPDVLTANDCPGPGCGNNGEVEVLLGKGDGTFRAAPIYSGGYGEYSAAVADVNGDGKPDLLVLNYCVDSACANSSFGVLLGNGDGTLQAVQTHNIGGYYAGSITVADVNGDGKPDLLVAGETSSGGSGSVGVLLGNGDGTFQTIQTYASGTPHAGSITVADVNGDGKPDLLVAGDTSSGSSGSVGVLLGNGDGSFRAAQTYGSGGYGATSVAVADLNGDGKPDLLVANACSSGNSFDGCTNSAGVVGVLLGNGDGTFQGAQSYSSGGYETCSAAVGDVNGDGKPDLVVTNSDPATVGVLLV